MKKALLFSVLYFIAFSASAECMITSVRSAKQSAAFKKYGGWSFNNYDQICSKLNRARARIQINATASVLANHSIGWASLSVVDLDSNVGTSDFASFNTQVHTYASQDKADEIMVAAMNEAADNWEGIDEALAILENERKKAKAMFGKKK